ncbi:class I adenylate-forming enzyme family protein [Streptomyces sp. ADMS]|uniref:class I adenylate-forming enzyme family protein n=1 Tax=Streptomyces sp. ADMS TaxID=3071415 RepID=UPI00296E89D6|nr:class I adenylate-forming enzyme family protein [Streptomyces sp. ADMS]MDW4910385.1 class I adenylate-forming enzyme family protein [Streptomyces sp. ADMS]
MSDEAWWGDRLLAAADPQAVWARSGSAVSFGELRAETTRLAHTLSCHGIRPGATVAVHGTPSFTQLWCVFALWSIGAQVILLEPALGRAERAALLELSAPQFVIGVGERHDRADLFVPECEVLVRRRRGGLPARTPHCLVQFSSGTTGRPKAGGRTAASLLTEVERLGSLPLMPGTGERVAVPEPIAHSFALIGGVLHALAVGATVVFPASESSAAVAEAVARSHVVLGRPHHFAMLADAAAGTALPFLRLAVSGGDTLPAETAGAFARRYGVLVGQAYGTTETGIVSTDLAGVYGPESIGVPVPGVRTRVTAGALQVHVPRSPHPYEPWPRQDGGWLSTYDLVTRDPATGALWLRGRAGQTASGAQLLDIEAVLRAHRHVTEAVVLGPDPVEAHVAGTDELARADLSAWCRRFLGEQAVPRRFHMVPELARSASGKLLRDRDRLHERGWAPRPGLAGRRR